MQRYEKYKDSGIAWIGEIPEGWEVKKLKYISDANPSNVDKKSKENEDTIYLCNYVDVYKNEFIDDSLDFMKATATENQIEKFILKKGDILVTKDSESPDDIANPTLVVQDFDNVVCGYHLTHIKPKTIYGAYLFRFFQTKYLESYFEVSANGVTRYGLSVDKFNSALILCPPLNEQKKIATYLTQKTKEIDTLITQKEQLLKLYEEEKRAIINGAVTDNIKSYIRLKYLISKIGSGVTPRGGASVYKLQGIPLLRSQNIYFDGLRLDKVVYITKETHAKMENSQVHQGDVLLNITGASIGRCYYMPMDLVEANVNQHVCIIRPTEKILTEFLYFVLSSNLGQEQINREQTGSGREGLNLEALKNFVIPSIDVERQQIIIDFIKAELFTIDEKIQKTKDIITLQKEYRTALISEVVTGKIKVTEEV